MTKQKIAVRAHNNVTMDKVTEVLATHEEGLLANAIQRWHDTKPEGYVVPDVLSVYIVPDTRPGNEGKILVCVQDDGVPFVKPSVN